MRSHHFCLDYNAGPSQSNRKEKETDNQKWQRQRRRMPSFANDWQYKLPITLKVPGKWQSIPSLDTLNLIIFYIFISNLKKFKSLPFYFSVIRDGAHGPWADRGRCNQEVIHVIAGHESLATPPPSTFLGVLKTEDLGSREHAQPILCQLMYKAKYEVPASVI